MNTELSIEKFSPTQIELTTLVDNAKDAIAKFNPEDETSLELFKSRRKDLQQARLRITETGKTLRSEALKFQKDVIAKEKEYLGLITPTEDEMKSVLEDLKQKEIREERMVELPERKKMIAEIGDTEGEPDDEELLALDHDQFVAYLNDRKARHLDRILAEQREQEAERKRKEEIKLAEERARKEAEEKAQKEAEERAERAQKEAEEKIEQARREKEEAERALQEEKERQERARLEEENRKRLAEEIETKKREEEKRNEKYQAWLKSHGYGVDDSVFLQVEGNVAKIYILKDTFSLI